MNPLMDPIPIHLTRDLRAAGYSGSELARLTRTSQWTRVRRGAYLRTAPSDSDARSIHRRLVAATLGQVSAGAVVSHMSAAVIHALPIWNDQLTRVHLTRARHGGGRTRRWVQVHGVWLDPVDAVIVEGFPVTSLPRTVMDLACTLGMGRAVAIGDAALRSGMRMADLHDLTERTGPRRGIPAARRAIAMLDGRSESPGESLSRVIFADQGLPAPELQFEVRDARGQLIGRADFSWPEQRTLGEFDGRVKYGRLPQPSLPAEEVLYAEKQREDALRETGWKVIRWCWDDLADPVHLAYRIRRALQQRIAA